MHYRNIKTGAVITVKTTISAPNYELIEGAEVSPKEDVDETEEVKKAPRKKRTKK